MIDALSAPNAIDDRVLLVETITRNQDRNRLADDTLGHVAKQPFGSAIPAGDDPVEIDAEDCIVGGLDDGSEPLRDLVRLLTLGDVHQHVDAAYELALAV